MTSASASLLRSARLSASLLLSTVLAAPVMAQNLDSLVRHAIVYSREKLAHSLRVFGDSVKYPRSTDSVGNWTTVRPSDWTSGFFPGCLWKIYDLTKDTTFLSPARRWTEGLEEQKFNTRTHDVGFIMSTSFGNGYNVKPDEQYRRDLLQAAQSLATRFNPVVGCIRSWDNRKWKFPVIIDNMMNLQLLFWASKHGGPHQLYTLAVSHALRTMEDHFRSDGSTYHVVSYDTTTGEVLSRETHQGYADESVWSRGQAWALHGFVIAYRETHDERFLNTAKRAANYFIKHLPPDGVPYWDFQAPNIPLEERDVSAASIACSGLYELAGLIDDSGMKKEYRTTADAILTSLCKPPYLSEGTNSMGILNHAVGNRPSGSEVDRSLIYGDYYFLEALLRFASTERAKE